MSGSTFPTPMGEFDDDLPEAQKEKLEAPRHIHLDVSKGGDRTGAYLVETWECPEHKIIVVQGEPCPKCGKKLLLD